jgi:DNA-binding GntR family transcriptional regulator
MQNSEGETVEGLPANQFHADLARRIVGLIRQQECPAGYQLKEHWLARELGVSRSPVRAALRLLDRFGVVRTMPNQGSFLTRPASELEDGNWSLPPTEEERLHAAITRDRFQNRLDRQINVTQLVREYDASRSLVERVLARLADEGLVEREAGRGWRFPPTVDSPQVYAESYRFRLAVEPMAILDPGFRPDPKRLGELKRLHEELVEELSHSLPSRRVVEIDAAFHEAVGEWSHNRFIQQAIQQQTKLRRLMEYQFSSVDRKRMTQSCLEHLSILKALEADNRQEAAELMRRHIGVSRDVLPEFEQQ